jgi:WD40 repeat protein
VIPELRKSLASEEFYDFIFTPGQNPFASLHRCLLNEEKDYQFREDEAQIALTPQVDTLVKVVEQLKTEDSRWLWFVDQFEELFTNCGDEQLRQQLIQGLEKLVAAAGDKVRIVLGMRADFLEEFSFYPTLGGLVDENNIHLVAEMHEQELRQAIAQPAAQHGIVFEQGLVEQIIEDVRGQKGYLPLLQYTLDLLWKQECHTQKENGELHIEDRMLNCQTYWDLQGVRGALRTRVEWVYQQMDAAEQAAVKAILLKLVSIVAGEGSDRVVSRRANRSEFAEGTIRATLQKLIDENLLVSSIEYERKEDSRIDPLAKSQVSTVEIAHETLLVSWERLKRWVDEEKEAIGLKNFLADETQRWQRVRQERGEETAREELLQGTRLEKIRDLRQKGAFEQLGGLREIENEFVDASLAEGERKARQARRRRRNAIASLSVFSGVALVLSLLAGWQWRSAVQQKQQVEMKSILTQAQSANALYLSGRKVESLIKSLEAYQRLHKNSWKMKGDLFQISYNIAQFLYPSQNEMANGSNLQHDDLVSQVFFRPDGRIIASTSKNKVKLWNRRGELLHTLQHNRTVTHVAFGPKNNTIASASGDQTVKLWNFQGELLQIFEHQDWVTQIAFSPNGNIIASASSDEKVKLWNRQDRVKLWNQQGKLLHTLEHENSVDRVVFSPDGNQVATVSGNKVKLWNRQGKLLQILEHQNWVDRIAYSSSGNTIVSVSENKVRVWNQYGKLLHTLEHQNQVIDVAFSNSESVITVSGHKVKLWNRYGKLLHTFEHQDRVVRIAISSDGNTIASASENNIVQLWNLQGKLLQTLPHQDRVVRLAFSPNDNIIASASENNTVQLWSWQSELVQNFEHKKAAIHVAFSSNDQTIVSAGKDNTVKLWNRQGKLLYTLQHEGLIDKVAFTPDSQTIVSAGKDNTVKLWNRQGKLLHTLQHKGRVTDIALSPDGQTIASASDDNTVKLWNQQGKLLHTLQHEASVIHVSFSPDSKTLASASWDKTVKLWNGHGKLLDTLQHNNLVSYVVFSRDGHIIASASIDGQIKLWNRQGQLLESLQHQSLVSHITFSQDGQIVASASHDNTVKLWNRKGELLQSYKHEDDVNYVAFSPEGHIFASASDDNTVKLWNRKGELLQVLKHGDDVWHVAFSPDGNAIASASEDGKVRLWTEWKTGDELIQQGCQWLQKYVHPERWNHLTVCQSDSSK